VPWNLGLVWDPITCLAPFNFTNPTGVSGWRHAIWDGTRYIVLDGDWLGVSTNRGQDWTFEAVSGAISSPRCIASNGNRIVTCGTSGTEEIFTSDNGGASWTSRATLASFNFPDVFNIGEVMSIVSDGSGFVLCGRSSVASGDNVFYSTDGASWTGVHVGPVSTNVSFSAVRYANGAYYMAGEDGGTLLLRKSVTGGSTWTTLTPPSVASVVHFPFLWALNGQLIMKTREVGDLEPMRLWTSSNEGASWTEITTGLYDIVLLDWTGSEWIAVTDLGSVLIGPTLSSLSRYGTAGDSLMLAVSNTNFIIETITSPTGSIRVIDLDCDDPFGVPFVWYNLYQHTIGDYISNIAIAGDDIWDIPGDSPFDPTQDWYENSWEFFPPFLPQFTRRPRYNTDFGGIGWSDGTPVSIVWVLTSDLSFGAPSQYMSTSSAAYASGAPENGVIIDSEFWFEDETADINLELYNYGGYYHNVYVTLNRAYLSEGRNVITYTFYPDQTTNFWYVCVNDYNSIGTPDIIDTVWEEDGDGVAADLDTGPWPVDYSLTQVVLGAYDQPDMSVALVRKAITQGDIDFWTTVDLAAHPGF
jgi:hypothetical protein